MPGGESRNLGVRCLAYCEDAFNKLPGPFFIVHFTTYFIPCWKTEFLLVLQMTKSAHCTTTILTKKAVWQVNSTIFLCS